MDIVIGDTITLSDNIEYFVASKAKYNDKNYYIIVDVKNHNNTKVCYENLSNYTLIELDNQDSIKEVFPSLSEETLKFINKINESVQ